MYAIASATEQAMQRLWGLPVVLVDSLAQGTGVVFDNRWVTLRDRRDVVVRMADRWAVEGTNTAPTGQYNIWCDILGVSRDKEARRYLRGHQPVTATPIRLKRGPGDRRGLCFVMIFSIRAITN